MLSEIEKLEAAQSDLGDSWIDELEQKCAEHDSESARISLENDAWKHRFDEYMQRRALGYRPRTLEELGFDNLIRYCHSVMSAHQEDSERVPRESYVQPKLSNEPVGEIVITRTI